MNLVPRIFKYFFYARKHPGVKRVVAVSAVLLAVDILLIGTFWGPVAWRHHELQKKVDDYRLRKRNDLLAQETADTYTRMMIRVKVLDGKLEKHSTQSELIESLSRLASRNRLRILSQDFDVTSKNNVGFSSFKQNVSLVGSYSSIRHYLTDLENLPTLTILQQARLERAREKGNQVRGVFELLTFEKSSGGVR